jgi:hypothetical protein
MISFLESLLEDILKTLEGLAEFFIKLGPLILKIIIFSSPFLALIILAYITLGFFLAAITAGAVLILIMVGLGYAKRQNLAGSAVSKRTIFFVVIADIIFGALILIKVFWFTNSSTKTNVTAQSHNAGAVSSGKEKKLVELLEDSFNRGDIGAMHRAVGELKDIKSQEAVPLIIKTLQRFYLNVDDSYQSKDARELCLQCIGALAEIESPLACDTLREIQIRNLFLSKLAKNVSSRICD